MRRTRVSNHMARELASIAALHREHKRPVENGRGWYKIQNLNQGAGTYEVYMYDEIGFWGVSAAEFVRELESLDAVQIDLRINSPGGDVWDGIAIYNALCNHPAAVTSYIDGLAASAASFIAQAGGKVMIARNGTMMIHDAEGICIGNAADMMDMAELLDRASNNIADIYAQRCSTVNQWRKSMRAVSWYVGSEAVDIGLADAAYEPEPGTDDQPAERRRRTPVGDSVHTVPVRNSRLSGRVPRPVSTAVPTHSTATTDEGTWDANAEQGKLPSPVPIAKVKNMYAWYDGERVEDGEVPKDACSLPHHIVADDGTPGAAHMSGVRNALSRVSQSDIPDSEQDAVRAHLNGHLDDGGGAPSGEDRVETNIGLWWNPEVFVTAVATAADQRALYGFDPGAFADSIRAVAENIPAIPDPESSETVAHTPDPTITRQQFEAAIKRGMI